MYYKWKLQIVYTQDPYAMTWSFCTFLFPKYVCSHSMPAHADDRARHEGEEVGNRWLAGCFRVLSNCIFHEGSRFVRTYLLNLQKIKWIICVHAYVFAYQCRLMRSAYQALLIQPFQTVAHISAHWRSKKNKFWTINVRSSKSRAPLNIKMHLFRLKVTQNP